MTKFTRQLINDCNNAISAAFHFSFDFFSTKQNGKQITKTDGKVNLFSEIHGRFKICRNSLEKN